MNTEAGTPMRTPVKVALLVVAGWATYAAVDNAHEPTARISFAHFVASAPEEVDAAQAESDTMRGGVAAPAKLALVASPGREQGLAVLAQKMPQQIPQSLYLGQLVAAQDANAGALPKAKRLPSTISNEATPVIESPETAIPLLGPVARDSGQRARVAPPFLACTIEIREHGVLVSHQTIGCTQSDEGERPSMLMEFGQEVPNEIPNMKYWLSVQVDGYRKGYPILRTRMELKGLLGRAVGRRKYESVTIVEPNKKHTVIAFNIDDDDFAVTIIANKQE
jgi:hypothetical protein